jgi:tetratricopeptide (TPR) repeat protein
MLMARRNEIFGRLLKAGISSIANIEGKTAPRIEEELGRVVGVAGFTIQRYKAGYLPPETRTVQILAEACVRRGLLNRSWLEQYLRAAQYPNPQELLHQLCPHVPEQQLPHVYENLPAPTYSQFVSREQLFAEILDGLQQRAAVVLVVGFSGTGKTSLAREIAARCLTSEDMALRFTAVVWVSDKDRPSTTNLSLVLDEIARTLDYPGFTQFAHDEKRRAVDQLLKHQKVLLVVDNFETTTDGALLDWLLMLPEPSKVIVTSRQRHHAFRQCCQVEVRGMSMVEASILIMHRLHTLRLDYLVNDPDIFSPLINLTNGNPKALELALGLVKYQHRTMPEVVESLGRAQGAVFDDLLARAWELLDEAARRVLLAMTFFPSSTAESAVSATADVGAQQLTHAMERLNDLALVDVQRKDLDTPPRYALHPLVRAFAVAKLGAQPGWELDARGRWLRWCLALAEQVGFCWHDLQRLELLDSEHEILHAALLWAFAHDRFIETGRLVEGVRYYYEVRLVWDDRQEINLIRAEAARRRSDLVDEALALAQYAEIRSKQQRLAETEQSLDRLCQIIKDIELPDQVAFSVQHAFALGSWMKGDLLDAEVRWRQLLPLAQRIGGQKHVVNRHWLGASLYLQGKFAEAQELYQAALDDATQISDLRSVLGNRIKLALIELDTGHIDRAEALLIICQSDAQQIKDRRRQGEIKLYLARIYAICGDLPAAQEALRSAIDLFERYGMQRELDEARAELALLINTKLVGYE